ncbi:PHP domain-containing protein [Actinospongicola halichondriae]|uniref:PHP domain-containing protein n=1 Tax=Actinospongicola halichondriae TaxID=3236844 RepID=UPI003D4750BD
MHPREALERVIYLLDRSLADGNKVRAYQRAIEIVDEVGDDELSALHERNALTELAGIGKSTGAVIAQALDGEVPKKIAELEASTRIEASEGADLRAALKGDCHMHSVWSDGGASIEAMAATARSLGHDYIVMTDHSPRLTIAHGLDRDRLKAQLDEIAAVNDRFDDGFRILTGMEVDILADGTLDLDDDLLDELDIVVASVHSKLSMDAKDMTRRMVMAVASPHVDILGHCTGQKVPGRKRQVGKSDFPGRVGSQFDADMVFAACAKFDTAVEINCRPERQDPPDHLLELALEWGCRVAIDTDAHAPGQLEFQAFGCDKAARHGITADRIVNAMTAGDLLDWAAAHPTS